MRVFLTSSQLEPAVGLMVNKVLAVRSPRELLNWSKPRSEERRVGKEGRVAGSGDTTKRSRAAALTCRVAVSVVVAAPASVPVTVWSAATVEVQVWVTSSQLEPAVGLMVNRVLAVRSPRELLNWSKPSAL